MPVGAGRRDRLVTIEMVSRVQDDFGQPIETWTAWRSAWMGKRDVQAGERFRANQTLSEEAVVWDSEWVPDLNPSDYRLNYEGRIYDIQGLAEVKRREGWEIVSMAVRV